MVFLRVFGKTLLFLAFIALAYDGARNLATPGQGLLLAPVSAHLNALLPAAAADLERLLAAIGGGWLWSIIVGPLLALPLSLVLGVFGTGLYLAGYRKPPPVLYGE